MKTVYSIPDGIKGLSGCLQEFDFHYKPAIYFLIKAECVVYVGQTCNLPHRIGRHCTNYDFDRVLFIEVEPDSLDEVERYWLLKLKPKHNGPHICKKEGRPEYRKRVSASDRRSLGELKNEGAEIFRVGLNSKVANALAIAGVVTLSQLKMLSEGELLEIHGLGEVALDHIKSVVGITELIA